MYKLVALLAIGAAIFFGRWNLSGLAPDAALYAGLSLKILQTSEWWHLSASSNFFPYFFEHPPYFFQWGAFVLKLLGESDGAARFIGAFPAYIGFVIVLVWVWKRIGESTAIFFTLMLLSFGHYTKYATTIMLEAPLSLGAALGTIGCVEFLYRPRQGSFAVFLCTAGCFLSVAAKGAAGFGLWGGIVLSIFIFQIFASWQISFSRAINLILLTLVASVLPLAMWAWMTYPSSLDPHPWMFREYWYQQVLRSFTTNRGSDLHSETGNLFLYFQVILKYGWPWWWTVPFGVYLWFQKRLHFHIRLPAMTIWIIVAMSIFFAFFVPFSLSTFQLPHYLHPVYLPLAPIGAFWMNELLTNFAPRFITKLNNRIVLWSLGLSIFLLMLVVFRGESKTPNRGQEFIHASKRILSTPKSCTVVVLEQDIDPYRMEAFSLWYFKGRSWRFAQDVDSDSPVSSNNIIWYPKAEKNKFEFVFGKNCSPGLKDSSGNL